MREKGFTLIELLAVIVILAVIALIATPIIMNVINESKQGAAKDAMFGYVKAVELAATKTITATKDAPSGTYKLIDGNLVRGNDTLDVLFKGTKPKNNGTVTLVNGVVEGARLNFNNIEVSYDGNKIELGNVYPVGEEIYFDPTGAVTNCDASKIWTPSNTGTTCYKWNAIKDNGNSIEMLLDHNTTAVIPWNSSGSNADGPKEPYNQLKTDTNNWGKVETLTSADNVTRANGSGGTYTINYSGMKAKLSEATKLSDFVKNNVWLFQNMKTHGDDSTGGYWTDTADENLTNRAWSVYFEGFLYNDVITIATNRGVRPVVRVLKSNI